MNGYHGIAHIIASNFFGGPERQVLTHARSISECISPTGRLYSDALPPAQMTPDMAEASAEGTTETACTSPLIITFNESEGPSQLGILAAQEGIATHTLVSSNFSPSLVTELAAVLRKHRIGILVSHGYKGNVIGRLATWLTGSRMIAVSRGWTAESRRIRMYESLDKLFLRFANHVVAVSHGQRNKILNCGVKERSVSVIHNCIDPAPYAQAAPAGLRTALGVPPSAPFIVSAGRLSPEKGHGVLLQAAAQLRALGVDAYFAVYGEGFLREELEKRIRELDMADRFFLPGFTENIPAVMHEADLFILPSYTEGLPNVALEASAAGTPIVATAVGGTPEVVRDGENGLLVPAGSPDAMAQAVKTLLESPETMRTMGEAGQRIVRQDFSFNNQTCQYQELYAALFANGHAPVFQEAR